MSRPEVRKTADPLVGRRVGHFQILARLGAGGMGLVYRAEDVTLGRVVALKVLRPELARDEQAAKRFLREARHAAGLVHPNVVTIHEADREEDLLFVAMELVDGPSLATVLADGPLPAGAALAVARDVAAALAVAHARSLVHRDVKPSNVVIVRSSGVAKLLDFGLAKTLDDGRTSDRPNPSSAVLTAPAQLVGTPAYMSPEQAWARDIDCRADVFSAGLVLHEMLSGVNPFKRANVLATLSAIREDAPPPLGDPELAGAFGPILERCLAKSPNDRFADGAALAAALDAVAIPADRDALVARSLAPSEPAAPEPVSAPTRAARRVFGRGADMAEIDAAFARGCRVVAIVGPAGIGKTRVAEEHELRRWSTSLHVDVASCSLADALAKELGIDGGLDAVGDALVREAPGLVVVDGIRGGAEGDVVSTSIAALRTRAQSTSWLAVSREPVACADHTVTLAPLEASAAADLVRLLLHERGVRVGESDARALAAGAGGNAAALVEAAAAYTEREPSSTQGMQLGHYRVLSLLGRGGMGVVYRAQDTKLERPVALKVLPPDLTSDERTRRRLLEEARRAAAVTHPCIAAIYDAGEAADGTVYIAMELVEGRSLRAMLAPGVASRLPLDEALRIVLDVARGLARAHDAGIVHCDIKPENVMLDHEGHVKILDFGLATLREADASRPSVAPPVGGTPEYMSPEQARGEKVGPASDVFSLGVVLHELVAGTRPFSSTRAVPASLASDEAPRLRGVPRALADLVARCLAKDASARPASARELARELEASRTPRRRGMAAVVGLAALAAAAIVATQLREPPSEAIETSPALEPEPAASPPPEPIAIELERLTTYPPERSVTDAAISPEGRRLAFVLDGALFVRDLASGEDRRYPIPATADASFVEWYASGDRLLAIVGMANQLREAWTVPLDGAAPERVMSATRATPSPDGREIAYTTSGDADCQLHLRAADGSDRMLHAGGCHWSKPVWSHDGTRVAMIALVDDTDASPSLVIFDRAGGTRTLYRSTRLLLSTTTAPIQFMPDGCLLALLVDTPDETAVHRICPDPGGAEVEPVAIAHFPGGGPHALALTADGTSASVVFLDAHADVYTAPIDASGTVGEFERATDDPHDDREPAFVDERSFVFHSNRSGRYQIYLQSLGGSAQRLTDEPGHATWPQVRGDELLYWSTALVAEGETTATTLRSLSLRAAAGGPTQGVAMLERRTLLFALGGLPSPRLVRVACTGARCIIGDQRPGTFAINMLEAAARGDVAGEVLVRGLGEGVAISPDGTRLAIAREDSLIATDLEGMEQRTLARWPDAIVQSLAWDPLDRGVFATVLGGDPYFCAYRIDPAGQLERFFASPNVFFGSVAVSPRGTRIAVTERPFDTDVWRFTLPSTARVPEADHAGVPEADQAVVPEADHAGVPEADHAGVPEADQAVVPDQGP